MSSEDRLLELLPHIQRRAEDDAVYEELLDIIRRLQQERDEACEQARLLRDNSRFLESIVENLPDMVFVKDAEELRFVRFNSAGERLLGHEREELLGCNDYDFFPEDEADFFTEKDRGVLEDGELVEIPEEPIHTATGLRWLHTKKIPILDEDGAPLYLLGISEDITERKRVEAGMRVLMDHLPGAMWLSDEALRLRSAAGARCDELGLTEAKGQPLDELLAPLELDAEILEAALKGEVHSEEFTLDGRTYAVRLEPVDREDAAGLVGLALDITDRQRLEAERLQSRLLRAQKLESLGMLAGGIAHDFNNLLASILGNASLALLRLDDDSPARPLVQRIETIADRASELTRQMLAYSGRGQLVVEPVNLSDLVREMASLLQVSICKDAALRMDFAEGLPPVEADASQLRQLVMNLITNASDALEGRAGTITLVTAIVEADRSYFESDWTNQDLPEGLYVTLEVSDTGQGMDEATRQRMFDPFFTTKTGGHGLGLAAALGIVRGHGGSLRVYSEPGRGTTIKVLLPAVEGSERPDARREAGDARPEGGTVLIVDDEASIRTFAAEALSLAGYQTLSAGDGVEALATWRRHRDEVDLVLLDMTMPRMDGADTFREFRRSSPELPVLLSSGYSEQEVSANLVTRQSVDFLQKPYRIRDLIERVRALLS